MQRARQSEFETPLEIGLAALASFLADRRLDHSVCPEWIVAHGMRVSDYAVLAHDLVRARLLTNLANLFKLVDVRNWYRLILRDFDELGISLDGRRAPHARLHSEVGLRQQNLFHRFARQRRFLSPEQTPSRQAIRVQSLCVYPEGSELVELALANHQEYTAVHGYEYVMTRSVPAPYAENPQFFKSKLIADWANDATQSTEWMLFIDCDAVFTNKAVRVEQILTAYGTPATNLLVAEDNSGINTGVLLVKRSPWTAEFFQAAMRHVHMAMAWDQSMVFFEILLRSGMLQTNLLYPPMGVAFVHQGDLNAYHEGTARSWNTYGWKKGDFVKHFAGCPQEEQYCISLIRTEVDTCSG